MSSYSVAIHFFLPQEVAIATAALGLCNVHSDTESDDSAFGSDLDE